MVDESHSLEPLDRRRTRAGLTGLALLALTLGGCVTVGPDFERPDKANGPDTYVMAGEAQPAEVRLDPDARTAGPWWRAFGSDALDQTVRLALAENPRLAEARATLERYQAAEQAVLSDLKPQSQANADAQRQKFNSQAFGFPGFPSRTFSLYSLGAEVSYDLDVFGGGRREREEAAAWTERAAHQADAAYLTLSGDVALQAVRLAGLKAQIAVARQIADDDARLLEIARQAEAMGGASALQVSQAEAQLADDEAAVQPLMRQHDAARHQLALLVGKAPAEWTPPDFDLADLAVPATIPVSLPSSLVRRRPDILAAEAELHAATAAVGVATAAQYPDIRLSARGALSSLKPGEVFSLDSTGWNLFGGVTAPVLDGGARKARTKAAEAEARAALARYRGTVLRAFNQVSDVMAAVQADRVQLDALGRAVTAAEREASVTDNAVGLGGASLHRAIEAKRDLRRKRRAQAEGQARLVSDMIELFAATAADWRVAEPLEAPMASPQDVRNRIPITGFLMLATLMNTLDSTIANVALPHMKGSLSASQDQIVWVLTSYILATAVMTPLSGWLAQKIGRKLMLQISIVGFTIASMLCGMATNVPEMVAFRLLQGLAGASLMPLSQSVMLDIFPMAMVPRVMSLWSAAVIMGPILGPTLGGWITENLSWRWVFYINLPIGVLAAVGVTNLMDHDPGGRQRPFDFIGFGALVAFVVGIQVMLDRGPGQDWMDSKEIWIELAIAMAGLWIFVVQTATAEHPFFHRDLIKDANFVGTTIFGFFVGVLLFSTTALLPSFMQNLLGYSALQSGLASMSRGVGSLVSFLLVPTLLTWFGARRVLLMGVVLCVVALWMMGQFNPLMTATPIVVSGYIQGAGVGLLFAPLTALSYVTLDQSHRVEGTIVSTMARTLGSSVGISVVQALVLRDAAVAHSELSSRMDPSSPLIRDVLPRLMDPATSSGLAILNGEVTRQASMIGYVNIFSWMTLVTVLMVPLIMILRPTPTSAPIEKVEAHAE